MPGDRGARIRSRGRVQGPPRNRKDPAALQGAQPARGREDVREGVHGERAQGAQVLRNSFRNESAAETAKVVSPDLLVAKGDGRVEPGSAPGRINAGDQAGTAGDADAQGDGPEGNLG